MAKNSGRIVFFMLPETFLELLGKFVVENQVTLLFRRYDTERFDAGYHLIPERTDLAQVFFDGGFRDIYLSLGCIPTHPTDWDFDTRCNEEVIEINLGRTAPGQTESSEARLYIPGGPAQPILDALECEIASVCHRGIRGTRHKYPDHYWSDEVRSMQLYGGALGKEQARAWPMEE